MVCWMKEFWIEVEYEKCGGNFSFMWLYKKLIIVLWVNI